MFNSIIILTILVLILKVGEKMNYTELAKQFLHYSYQLQSFEHQKEIDKTMQGEAFALLYILKKDDCTFPSEISNEMCISSARVAAILNNLENKGYISRQIDKSDRRKILVQLTQEGVSIAKEQEEMVLNLTTRMLEVLGENDAKELVRITGRLTDLIPKIMKER